MNLTERDNAQGAAVVPLLVAAAFGPYLVAGVRTDQAAAYLLVGATAFRHLATPHRPILRGPMLGVLFGWCVILWISGVQVLMPPPNITGIERGSWLANFDALMLPVAVSIVVAASVTLESWTRVLKRVCAVVTVAMVLNALIAVLDSFMSLFWLNQWLASGTESVADRAATLGRYTGILNQPALAGVMYGIAILCATYWLRRNPVLLIVAVLILSVGGFIVVSKAFLYIGLPIGAWNLLRSSYGRVRRIVGLVVGVTGVWLFFGRNVVRNWSGIDYLRQQVPSMDSVMDLALITGGRYGSDGAAVADMAQVVVSNSPWFGFGLAGLDAPTDAAWLEIFVLAGIVGVAGFLVALMAICVGYMRTRRLLGEPERRLLASTVLLLIASSVGFPTLTGNRLAVIAWVLIALLMIVPWLHGSSDIVRAPKGIRRSGPNGVRVSSLG